MYFFVFDFFSIYRQIIIKFQLKNMNLILSSQSTMDLLQWVTYGYFLN